MSPDRRITFLTGTRADFGKLKPLILAARDVPDVECSIFVTGMHMLARYGLTVKEVERLGPDFELYRHINQGEGEPLEMVLANTVQGLSRYLQEYRPDLLVVHGDRVEALAGAIAGALRNVLVVHVEGGELSGTIDGVVRHAVTKLAHVHLVANEAAATRLMQLGEPEETVHVIGSPDIDVLLSDQLPSLDEVRAHYEIDFDQYGIVVFHPVTFEVERMEDYARWLVDALLARSEQFVVIYPNNDPGSDAILREYDRLGRSSQFRLFPSLRFEYFVSLLQGARLLVGNSSAGVREAPIFGVPTVDVGSRQRDRFWHESIVKVGHEPQEIAAGIEWALAAGRFPPSTHFGTGHAGERFAGLLAGGTLWDLQPDKRFVDMATLAAPREVSATL